MPNLMTQTSEVTGITYDPSVCVFIFNMLQVARYLKHGAKPVDIFLSDGEICFVFRKEDTYELYRAWCARTLE